MRRNKTINYHGCWRKQQQQKEAETETLDQLSTGNWLPFSTNNESKP